MKTFDIVCTSDDHALGLVLELDEADLEANIFEDRVTLGWRGTDFAIYMYELAVDFGYLDYESASDQLVSYL